MKNQSFMKYSFGNFLLLLLLSLQACAQTKDRIQTSETVVDTLYRPTSVFPIPNNVYKKYMNLRDNAENAYKSQDFKKCGSLCDEAMGTVYMKDGYLRYMAGVSYFHISQESNDKAHKAKSYQLLIQAKHEGFPEAHIFLTNNFKN